jgi:hypothetical protein
MQADSPKRRERVAPGIYVQDGNFYAGYNEPGSKRWRLHKLAAKNLRDAKRERGAHLAALREGRAATASTMTFDTCLDVYLEALTASGAREKTIRHNRWIAERYLRDELGAKSVQKITTSDARRTFRAIAHLSGWTQVKVMQVMREGFAVAIREDVIVRSPLEKLDPARASKAGLEEEAATPRRRGARAAARRGEDEDTGQLRLVRRARLHRLADPRGARPHVGRR